MGRLQPSGGIWSAWFPQGAEVEVPATRCCAKCKSPYGCARGNCPCHAAVRTAEKEITEMNGESNGR